MQVLERTIIDFDWITVIFLASIACVAIAKLLYQQQFDYFIGLIVHDKFLSRELNNVGILAPLNVLMLFVQLSMFSLFILMLGSIYLENISLNFENFYLTFLVLLLIAGIRYIIDQALGYLFNISPILNNYLFGKLAYRNLNGVMLIPINMILVYSLSGQAGNIVYWIILSVFLLFSIMNFTQFALRSKDVIIRGSFYFLLYICSLEIAPYFVLYKAFI